MQSLTKLLGTALLSAVAVATPALAAEARAELRVPFSFAVEGRTLPAGDYTVAQEGDLLYIEGAHQSMIVSPVLAAYTTHFESKLTFQRRNGLPNLSNVQISGQMLNIPVHSAITSLAIH